MAATTDELRIADIPTGVEIDPVTLDIIEGALKILRNGGRLRIAAIRGEQRNRRV